MLILDRPRHEQIIADVREAGARIRLISDGDVGGAIETCNSLRGEDPPVDIMYGIGGTPTCTLRYTTPVQCTVQFVHQGKHSTT